MQWKSLQIFITARKRSLEQGNIFAPVCHSIHRGVVSQYALHVVSQHALQQVSWGGGIPACLAGLLAESPGPHPGGKGVSRPTPRGKGSLQARTWGGCASQHAPRQTPPPVDGYCHRWYASYWNAFLLFSSFLKDRATSKNVKILSKHFLSKLTWSRKIKLRQRIEESYYHYFSNLPWPDELFLLFWQLRSTILCSALLLLAVFCEKADRTRENKFAYSALFSPSKISDNLKSVETTHLSKASTLPARTLLSSCTPWNLSRVLSRALDLSSI